MLEDFDAIYVRMGDMLEIARQQWWLFPGLDQKTRPQAIRQRIAPWIADGRTLYILSNEPKVFFFDALKRWYRVCRYQNFPALIQLKAEDNYLLYEVEQCVAAQARIYVKMYRSPGQSNGIEYSLLDYSRSGTNSLFSRVCTVLALIGSKLKRYGKKLLHRI